VASDNQELLEWAKRALKGLDDSQCFVGILGDKPLDAARAEFILQIGYAVLHGKDIILPAPYGTEIPPKLRAVADKIVYYIPGNPESLQTGLQQALTEMMAKRH
jgi:hypothetical protein